MDDKQRIRQLETECQRLIDSVYAFRMKAMCFNENIKDTSQARTLKEDLIHAKDVLDDSEPER